MNLERSAAIATGGAGGPGAATVQRSGHPEELALLVESTARDPYLDGESTRHDGALRVTAT